jgi:acyl-CoA thioester hydrolase
MKLILNKNLQNLDGIIQGNKHYYYIKVYYEDTDAGQIVYHSNYLKYFERARTSLLNLLSIDQVDLRKNHKINLVVRKADLMWHKPALFNDTILIKSCLKYAKNTSITIYQQACRFCEIKEKDELLVSCTIQIVAINKEFKVKRINNILKSKFFQNK